LIRPFYYFVIFVSNVPTPIQLAKDSNVLFTSFPNLFSDH